jgi:type III secretory pathway component EscU
MAKNRIQTLIEMTAVTSKSANWVLGNFLFVLFLGFVAVIYIANSRYAERNIREIQQLQLDLKELRREYNALNTEVMQKSRRSEIAKKVEPMGLKPSNIAPKKIVVEE